MHRLTALVISLALLAGLFVYAPQSVRAAYTYYIGPGGGNGECASPDYITNGDADEEQFQSAATFMEGDIDNVLYVCPDTYDIESWITVNGPLTIASVGGAANTILDATDNAQRIIGFLGDAVVIGLTFQNADANWEGAAIYAGSSLTVRDSIFLNNHSDVEGGAIDFSGDEVAIVTGSTFIGNSALEGGAINVDYDLDLVADSTFTDNETTSGRGGAILIVGDVYDKDVDGESGLIDNIFSNNSAESSGGAVYVSGVFSGSLMSKNTFKGNSAGLDGDGGAFFLDDDFENGSQMIDNVFSGNTAGDDGGAVMLYWDMDEGTLISGNTFSENKADGNGGEGGDNGGEGGGLQIDDNLGGTITNNRFLNNEADYGGGLYSEDLTGTAVITMNTFRSNVATADGGGIWLDDNGYDSSELAIFTKNSFRGNRASDNGGALYLSFTNTEVGPSFFTRNMYRGNRAALGGAIAFKGFGSADVGEVAGDCSAPLTSSRIAVRIFKKDRFVSNRATRSRRTANVGLMACEADLR